MNEHAAFVIDIVDLALFHAKRDANKTALLSTSDVSGGICWAEHIAKLESALAWLRSFNSTTRDSICSNCDGTGIVATGLYGHPETSDGGPIMTNCPRCQPE